MAKEGKTLVRETLRDVLLALGVIFAGIQVYEGLKHPEKIGNALPWLLVVCLFVCSAALYAYGAYRKNKSPVATETTNTFNDPLWKVISNHRFANEAIDVDGKSFRRCSFTNISFLFHGTAPTEFIDGCTFEGSVRLSTDHPPTKFWLHLHSLLISIPGATVESSAVDQKGQPIKTVVQVQDVESNVEGKKRLRALDADEKRILSRYIASNSRTQYFHMNNGSVANLISVGILRRAVRVGQVHNFPTAIEEWAWEYLREHSELLE